jgi:hypothetical protein
VIVGFTVLYGWKADTDDGQPKLDPVSLVMAGISYHGRCMATMIPSKVKNFHGSKSEELVFLALRGLPDGITIIHSFRWLHPGKHRSVTAQVGAQGEGDFVLFDPTRGIMVIEVKGGDIWCERGEWRQRNRATGAVFSISPEEQAGATVHRIREEIQARIPAGTSLLCCHAIWFPEGIPDRANLPMNCPTEIVLDEEDIGRPAAAIQRAFAYWRKALPNRGGIPSKDAQKVLEALAPTFSLVPSIRRSLDDREAQLVQLTLEQAKVVHFLDEQRHAAVHGAAGTGKTMVALEKARRLASPSEPVLFLCYNSALRAHLQTNHPHPNVHYATFHAFAREQIGPGGSLEDAEQALLDHLIDDRPIPYVHLIVDEGQDFKADWLEFLGHRFRDGAFYVFYDRHQLVQGGDLKWLEDIPCRLVLTRNCRNTDEIARVAYRAAGLSIAPTLGVSGPRPVLHVVKTAAEALSLTQALLETACVTMKSAPHDLAVLTIETQPLDNPLLKMRVAGTLVSPDPTPGHVTLMTVRRFKGLEASLVIVPDADFRRAEDIDWRRRLYVACSRARQAVHIITTVQEADIGPAVRAFANTDKARPTWRGLARHLGIHLGEGVANDPFYEQRSG